MFLTSSFGLQSDWADAAGMGRSSVCVLGGQGAAGLPSAEHQGAQHCSVGININPMVQICRRGCNCGVTGNLWLLYETQEPSFWKSRSCFMQCRWRGVLEELYFWRVFYHPVSKEQRPLTCFQLSIPDIKCQGSLVASEHLSQKNAGLAGMLIFLGMTLSSLKHALSPTLFSRYWWNLWNKYWV